MVETLSIEEFERLLSRGRGKAILYLQTHDAAPYREAIRRCCLTNTVYSEDMSGSRAPYLMDVMEHIGETEAMCEAAIQIVHATTDVMDDFGHLFDLLRAFAQRGLETARQAMYAWCRVQFNPMTMTPEMLGALIKLDGVDAFLFLLDPLEAGYYPELEWDESYDRLMDQLEYTIGEAETRQALEAAAQGRPALWDTIAALYARRTAEKEEARRKRVETDQTNWFNLPYAQLRQEIENGLVDRVSRWAFWQWSRNATEEDFLAAAHDFATQDLPLEIWSCYANMFHHRAYPLNDFSRLFEMVRQTHLRDEEDDSISSYSLAYNALKILKNISHPQIRDFALEMITARHRVGRVSALLINNFEEGDWTLINSLFDAGLHEHEIHELGFSLGELAHKYPSPEAVAVRIRMFDRNPCSFCRERDVKSLVSLNALPDWIAEECRYDANLDLRAYAERGFKDDDDSDD